MNNNTNCTCFELMNIGVMLVNSLKTFAPLWSSATNIIPSCPKYNPFSFSIHTQCSASQFSPATVHSIKISHSSSLLQFVGIFVDNILPLLCYAILATTGVILRITAIQNGYNVQYLWLLPKSIHSNDFPLLPYI